MLLRRKKEKDKKELKLKIDKDEKVQEGELVETEWDIKKLAIGLVILVLLIIVGSYFLFPSKEARPATLGVSEVNLSPTPPLPDQEDVQGIINNAKATLDSLTSDNVTSSQAAIQKVINDLETLKGEGGAMELMCKMVCKN